VPINVPAPRAPTWPALFNILRLDRSFAGHRDEKTFTIRGESAATSEGRRYIVTDKSMHVLQAAYVSAFEHISYSARCSAITHVASTRVRMTLLACQICVGDTTPICVRYLVKKERTAFTSHTRIPPNVAGSHLYRPPYAFRAALASCWLCFLCCEKHHSCSLLRDIHSYAFLMQPAIFPRPSEAQFDNPALPSALYDSLHTLGLGLAWERGLCAVK